VLAMKTKSKGKNQKSKIKNEVPQRGSQFLTFDFCLLIFDLPFVFGATDV
jgi:hypothetical protein